MGYGSGRSIAGFNLYKAIKACSPFLNRFGGHHHAVGIQIYPQNLSRFTTEFEEIVRDHLPSEDLKPCLKFDAELSMENLDLQDALDLGKLEPFGVGNPEPVWVSRHLPVQDITQVGKKHLRFTFGTGPGKYMRAIGFGMVEGLASLGSTLDVAYTMYVDDWDGVKKTGIKVKDTRNCSE